MGLTAHETVVVVSVRVNNDSSVVGQTLVCDRVVVDAADIVVHGYRATLRIAIVVVVVIIIIIIIIVVVVKKTRQVDVKVVVCRRARRRQRGTDVGRTCVGASSPGNTSARCTW